MTSSEYRALVVEHDSATLCHLGSALNGVGFNCVRSKDGRDAMSKVKGAHYDVAVIDVGAQHDEGYDLVCQMLREDNRPLFLAATGVNDGALVEKLLARGVDDILLNTMQANDIYAAKIKFHVNSRRNRFRRWKRGEIKERRWSRRVECNNLLEMALYDGAVGLPGEDEFRVVTARDLSANGVSFYASETIKRGQPVVLRMVGVGSTKLWKAEVIRCTQARYVVACRLTGVLGMESKSANR